MSDPKKLTPAEWELMEAVWKFKQGPSIREVLESAFPNGEKAYTTVQTLMNVLVKKGLLKTRKIGLVNFYKPTVSREKMVHVEMSTMVKRVFKGSLPALANYIINSKHVGIEEIEAIKAVLKQREAKLNST